MKLEVITHEPVGAARGVPLLFVHGAWHGAWCWNEHFLPYFAEHGFTSVALSLRGHGDSDIDKNLRIARVRDYVADVEAVASEFETPPVVVGHSMGGLVTQKYLESHVATAGVLLASDPVKGALRATIGVARRHPLAFLKANLTWDLYPIVATPELAREAFFSEDLPEDELVGFFEKLQSESYLAYLDMLFGLPKPERVDVPMLVIGGESDKIFAPDEIRETAAAYRTEAILMPGIAHDMMLDSGWQSVADRILSWLVERPGA